MSDHISGPRALAEPIADITDVYAFPSPDRPGHLVLVVNTLPFAPPDARLSDGLIYRFRVRPLVEREPSDYRAPFGVGDEEVVVDCVFSEPSGAAQEGTCTTPAGDVVSFQVDDDGGGDGAGGLHDVLERARPAGGVEVRFEGADHGPYHLQPVLAETNREDLAFVRSLPLALATDPEAEILVAYEMNGEPLLSDHGAPFRLIVPHWYAVASVKWLKRIDVLTEPYAGEFQTGHYIYEWPDRPHEPVALMRVRARITDPAPGATLAAGTYIVRGKAWSGTGPVTRVELSFTGEGEWHPAKLEEAAGPYQWQDWSFEWDATGVGRHSLRARATDAAGNVQPEVPPWNRLGYGNNAIEVSYVDVR